jgi:hypothetical protein
MRAANLPRADTKKAVSLSLLVPTLLALRIGDLVPVIVPHHLLQEQVLALLQVQPAK